MGGDGTVSWRALHAETTGRLRGGLGLADGAARAEARWLCESASGIDHDDWAGSSDELATERAVARLDAMVARRLGGEPLAYVLGSWAFRTLDLLVDRRVLIPRPETEVVVEHALALVRAMAADHVLVVADLGTGSGAIACSLAAELALGSAAVWATDVSADALEVTRANLAGTGRAAAHVRLAEGSWFAALPAELEGRLDLVVSNPPYVAIGDDLDDAVARWEPVGALFAGADGLDAVRVLVTGAARWLRPGGWLVVEIGAAQGTAARALAGQSGLAEVAVHPDLAGRDRVLVARRPS